MVVCLASARFNMRADILKATKASEYVPPVDPDDGEGTWITTQDPDSGEIIREWKPGTGDNPETVEYEGLKSFKCLARGIVDGGIRVAGTTERFSETYDNADFVQMWFPAGVNITRRDRITNIRDPRGNILWREEERMDQAPTVFSVVGVTPLIDPFGRHTESKALLERAEGQ